MKLYTTAILIAAVCLLICGCDTGMKARQTGYTGDDISGEVEILRDRLTKTASVKVSADTRWALYAGNTVEDIDLRNIVESGQADGEFPIDVDPTVRSYFQVVTPHGQAIMAERVLPMTGGFNFRDMGGYRMQDGRYVKWGKLIRSDEMSNLTDDDLSYLSSVPLISVVDFRSEEEISKAPDKLPSSVEHHHAYSVAPGNIAVSVMDKMPTEEEATWLMEETNRLLVSDPETITQYRLFFELLADEANLPLLFHCTAGKDRTGMASALILYALGADDDTVMADYMTSKTFVALKYGPLCKRFPDLEPLLTVRENYLTAGLDEINSRYGSVKEYLTGTLNADLEKLKELYLY